MCGGGVEEASQVITEEKNGEGVLSTWKNRVGRYGEEGAVLSGFWLMLCCVVG